VTLNPIDTLQKHPKIFYGWWIVAACIPITVLTNGLTGGGFTAFFEPIASTFGWTYAQVSIGASLRTFQLSIFVPFAGLLADRWGPRKVLLIGAVITGLGMVFMSLINSLATYYAASVVIAIGAGFCNSTVVLIAVANWFKKNISKAIAVTTIGVSLNGLMIILATFLIDRFGWQHAMFGLGWGVIAIVVPLTLVVRHKPEQYGYLPDGEKQIEQPVTRENTARHIEDDSSLGQALKSRIFWQLVIASLCFMFSASAYQIHVMPYYSSIGFARSASSLIVSGGLLIGVVGALGVGWLGDRLDTRNVSAVCYVGIVVGLVTLGLVTNKLVVVLVTHIITFNMGVQGAIVMRTALVRQYFGRSKFGSIIGVHNGIATLGGITGVFLAGWAFDTFGSYRTIWLVFGGLAAISIILILAIPRKKLS